MVMASIDSITSWMDISVTETILGGSFGGDDNSSDANDGTLDEDDDTSSTAGSILILPSFLIPAVLVAAR